MRVSGRPGNWWNLSYSPFHVTFGVVLKSPYDTHKRRYIRTRRNQSTNRPTNPNSPHARRMPKTERFALHADDSTIKEGNGVRFYFHFHSSDTCISQSHLRAPHRSPHLEISSGPPLIIRTLDQRNEVGGLRTSPRPSSPRVPGAPRLTRRGFLIFFFFGF